MRKLPSPRSSRSTGHTFRLKDALLCHKQAHPDLRIGQIIVNSFPPGHSAGELHHHLFNIEDDKLVELIERYLKEIQ